MNTNYNIKKFSPEQLPAGSPAGKNYTVLMNTPFGGLSQFRSVYFIGIGGIGMSAIARFFHEKGVTVSGYDKTKTPLTEELEREGIAVHYTEDISQAPADPDLVIFTPAIPKDHKELVHYQAKGVKIVKRSDVLQIISENSFNICVAGTHGKTTISTMIAHILRDSGFGCNAFLGGLSANYGTNYWSSERNVCVIEADEYDRSFLKLSPHIAVISAMDADHLDIYGTAAAMEQAFIDFSNRIREKGVLLRQFGLKRGKDLNNTNQLTYSLQNENADVYAKNITITKGSYEFDLVANGEEIAGMKLNMGGMHNVENAVVASAVAMQLGIDPDKIINAVASFKGVRRRFEYIIRNDRLIFIDDYAHHPEELRALINGARTLFKAKKCTVVFQPHLYTRTRDLAEGFAEVLDIADETILLPIYPARELPIEGVSSEMIRERMQKKCRVMSKEELMKWIDEDFSKTLNTEFGEIFITAGAGDIDALVEPAKQLMKDLQ